MLWYYFLYVNLCDFEMRNFSIRISFLIRHLVRLISMFAFIHIELCATGPADHKQRISRHNCQFDDLGAAVCG